MFSSLYWSRSLWRESVGSWAIELEPQLLHCQQQLQGARLRRARDYYLYFDRLTGQGCTASDASSSGADPRLKKAATLCRLLDLGLDGGQALNGYCPAAVALRLKNAMSRSLYAALPSGSASLRRLGAVLQRLFPRLQGFGLYHNLTTALPGAGQTALRELLLYGQTSIGPGQNLSLWRPLAAAAQPEQGLVLPVLALSSLPQPYLLLAFTPFTEMEASSGELPPSDICSPLQLETLAQALGQTESLLQTARQENLPQNTSGYYAEALQDFRNRLSKVGKKEKGSLPQWRQDGIYLYWDAWDDRKQGLSCYTALWQRCFEQGFLLPANPLAPLILPPQLLQKDRQNKRAPRLSSKARRLEELLSGAAD